MSRFAFFPMFAFAAVNLQAADLKGRSVFESVNSMAMAMAHVGDKRVWIAQRNGTVTVFPDKGAKSGTQFIKVPSASCLCINDEAGLIGMAFHPDYLAKDAYGYGRFYLYYTVNTSGHDGLFEYKVTGDPATSAVADPASKRQLILISDGGMHHNAGSLAFDNGKNLFLGIGDGNLGAKSWAWAQSLDSFHGKILRIIPEPAADGKAYRIPADNPEWPGKGRNEIYALGLRNPYRISWDKAANGGGGALIVGDVGQSAWEEVNIIQPGKNYGWGDQEGSICSAGNCSMYTLPLYKYPSGGAAIIGGAVYRGKAMPARRGQYFFADYYQKIRVMSDPYAAGTPTVSNVAAFNTQPIFSFGEDSEGEVYAMNWTGIFILEETMPTSVKAPAKRISATPAIGPGSQFELRGRRLPTTR